MSGQVRILDSTGTPIVRRMTRPARGGRHTLDIQQQRGTYGFTGYGYKAATAATHDGRAYTSYSGDQHLSFHRKKLLAHSRDLLRNNGIYVGMIERAVSYIVGGGFGLRVRTANKKANTKIEGLWRQWFKRPEIRGLLNGGQVGRMVCRELLAAGDVGITKTDKATIRLIEAEQIDHPLCDDGIAKDAYGTPKTYHVCPYGKNGVVSSHDAKPVHARDFLFITDPKRPSQTRGVPALQSSFPMLHRISDVCDSEAISWQLLARFAVAVLREGGPEMGYAESASNTEKTDSDSDDTTTRITELDYALMFHGQPGESVQGIDRNIPGKDFPESIRMFLRLLGLPLGLPLEIILLDWTKSNYSQSRAVLEQAFETFECYQDILEAAFFAPLLAWKIDHWSGAVSKKAMDELRLGVNRDGAPVVEWIRPSFPWLDQLKEAQAQAAKLDRTLTTHAHVCKSLKLDREDVLATREQEVTEAIEIGQRLSKKFDTDVDWRIFAGLDTKAAAPAVEEDPDDEDETDDEKKPDDGKAGKK